MPWSSVKQLRTVLETEYSIDDIFYGQLHFFSEMCFKEKYNKDAQAKSEKAKEAYGLLANPFSVSDQNAATDLYYQEVPLPW